MVAISPIEPEARATPELPVRLADTAAYKLDNIDLYSEPVQEVLGVPPSWLVRWGSSAILLVIVALGSLSWTIHYPDVVPATIVVTSSNPPASVIARSNGELVDVRVHDNDHVEKGAVLAIIGSTTKPSIVFQLEQQLDTLGPDLEQPATKIDFLDTLPLGELQTDYSTFVRSYRAWRYNVEQDPIGQQIRSIEPQLEHQQQRLQGYVQQQQIVRDEIEIADRDYQRGRELAYRQVMDMHTVDERQRQLLQLRRDQQGVQLDIAATHLDIDRLQQNLVELRVRDRQQRHDLASALAESTKNLRSRLAVWERDYVLRAPISGRVSLFRFWSDHQVVQTGNEVLTIVNDAKQAPIGKLALPLANSGKVKPGQAVYIQLDDYPYAEYGRIKGTVSSVATVPREARYAVEVTLPDPLTTSFGRRLAVRQEMQGQAEIVTEDLRLLDRIFYQIRKLVIGEHSGHASPPGDPAPARPDASR
ncbi:MAG TPA: HlyD family efflux transporter periplasmic adaptor subunit [Stellaceae bacterium]|jgi:multidrug resistance efflux pump|nr:HlyD family efflux transporter periplasmic adaptor subunit [Stellaceae bacterium]